MSVRSAAPLTSKCLKSTFALKYMSVSSRMSSPPSGAIGAGPRVVVFIERSRRRFARRRRSERSGRPLLRRLRWVRRFI